MRISSQAIVRGGGATPRAGAAAAAGTLGVTALMLASIASVASGALPHTPTEELAAHTYILVNDDFRDSAALAEEYCQLRGVSRDHILSLRAGVTEEISRANYEHFIRRPFFEQAQKRGWMLIEDDAEGKPRLVRNDIWILLLMRGMPLRIGGTQLARNLNNADRVRQGTDAALDSELACLPLLDYAIEGAIENSFHRQPVSFNADWARRLILVTRIDGPEVEDARRLMRDAAAVEPFGLAGRAYIDARGLTKGGYAMGDEWLRRAYDLLWKAGFELDKDESEAVLRPSYPMTDTAFYAGWYSEPSGPFTRDDFRLLPGAVAYHIISNSGVTIRPKFASRTSWITTLVQKGAGCTMGAVSEPFLGLSTHVDVFAASLLEGFTFAEAAYHAQPALSWKMTAVGDPLYRPFAIDPNAQLEQLHQAGQDTTWAAIRNLNLLFRNGRQDEALALCTRLLEQTGAAVYAEKLAQFAIDSEDYAAASERWWKLADQQADPALVRRALLRLWRIGELTRDEALRYRAMDTYAQRFPDDDLGEAWYKRLADLAEKLGDAARLALYRERSAKAGAN